MQQEEPEIDAVTTRSDRSLLDFVLATFIWSWAFFIPVALSFTGLAQIPSVRNAFLLTGVFGPSLSSWALTYKRYGKEGLARMLQRGFAVRLSPLVYLFVILVPLTVAALGSYLTGDLTPRFEFLNLLGITVLYFFLGGSFGEEFGWRGFALPRLLDRFGPISASLILGVIWGFWHLPLFNVTGTSQSVTPFWLFLIYTSALAVQYTWVFISTRGNLFACLLFHTFTNITVEIFPLADDVPDKRIYYETGLNVLIAICLAFVLLRNRTAKELGSDGVGDPI
jgi:membrane protease YdiL (CAAX protease family)